MNEKLIAYLHRNHGIPPRSINVKQLSGHIEALFNERFTTSLSYLDQYRVRRDVKLIHSIERKLTQSNSVIRVTDKSHVFHIGQATDYDCKVAQYQIDTKAYVQLPSNPLTDTFYKVVRLLNDLRTKQQIRQWQLIKMMPDQKKMKLAHLYFIPKPHKVNF
jgi:hypothetical protein